MKLNHYNVSFLSCKIKFLKMCKVSFLKYVKLDFKL